MNEIAIITKYLIMRLNKDNYSDVSTLNCKHKVPLITTTTCNGSRSIIRFILCTPLATKCMIMINHDLIQP